MSTHHPRHREGGRAAAALLFSYLAPARGVLADVGSVAGVLCALGVLPLATPQPPAPSPPPSATVTLDPMSDLDGLEEFGGLARWRDVVLRFPTGHTETHRLLAINGRLPSECKRPLNQARTTYEWFVLAAQDADTAIYEWRDIEER